MNQIAKFKSMPLIILFFGVVALGLTVAGVAFAMRVFEERYFEIEAEQISEGCFDSLRDAEKSIHAVSALFTSSSEIDSDAFRIISEQMLSQIPTMKSIRFAQVVRKEDQSDFEAKMQKALPGYRVQLGDEGDEGGAADFLVVNQYFEPLSPSALSELGMNILKQQTFEKPILRAIEQGSIITVGPVLNEKKKNLVYYFLKAIYSGKMPPQDFELRKKSAIGMIIAEIDITELVSSLGLRDGFRVNLLKKTKNAVSEDIFQEERIVHGWRGTPFAFLHKMYTAKLSHFSYELSVEKKVPWNVDKIIILFFVLAAGLATLFLAYSRVRSFVQMQIEVDRQVKEKTQIIEEQRARMANTAKLTSLGEMAGGIAHEINNPLAVMKLLSGQIQKEITQGPGEVLKILQKTKKIEDMIDRITSIISGLRSFSRDGEKDEARSVSIDKILQETLSLCQEKIRSGGVDLRCDPVSQSLEIECKEVQMSQVILNLVSNAYDAVSGLQEKWIQVSVQDLNDKVQIEITDSGKGISKEIQEKIFQPFFTTKEIGKGTGLGLSVSMGIIQKHKGQLFIDPNCPNTRFVILLPKKRE